MRTILIACLAALAAAAAEPPQIRWIGAWEKAFERARKRGVPVMVCINSKDGESANETTANEIYRDPVFVALSRRFVMVAVSTREHAAAGPCPRLGGVTCAQHLECWKDLKAAHGEEFCTQGDEMISPQHAWFAPDGRLLERKEYFLGRNELLRRMQRALATVAGKGEAAPGPLDDADRAALEQVRGSEDPEARTAALGTLLAADKASVYDALADLAASTRDPERKGELLRVLVLVRAPGVRTLAEKLLTDADPGTRSRAAVALEDLADARSVAALARRATMEDDATARKNACRALGACGGPAADKTAAKALLKVVGKDKQKFVSKHAALALRCFAGDGADLVRRKLERAAADAKDREVRQACIYALAYVGEAKSTVPVLEKLLEDERDEWAQSFVRGAIAKLQSAAGEDAFGPTASFLFWEDREDPARAE